MLSFQHLPSVTSTLLRYFFLPLNFNCKHLIPLLLLLLFHSSEHQSFIYSLLPRNFVPYFFPLPVIYFFPPLAADSCRQLFKSLNKFKYLKLSGVLTSSKKSYPSWPYLPLPDSLLFCPPNPGLSAEILADEMWCSEVSTQQKCHQPESETLLTQRVLGSSSYLNSLSPRQLSVTVFDHCHHKAGGEYLPPALCCVRGLCCCQCHFHTHRDELEIRAGSQWLKGKCLRRQENTDTSVYSETVTM